MNYILFINRDRLDVYDKMFLVMWRDLELIGIDKDTLVQVALPFRRTAQDRPEAASQRGSKPRCDARLYRSNVNAQ